MYTNKTQSLTYDIRKKLKNILQEKIDEKICNTVFYSQNQQIRLTKIILVDQVLESFYPNEPEYFTLNKHFLQTNQAFKEISGYKISNILRIIRIE